MTLGELDAGMRAAGDTTQFDRVLILIEATIESGITKGAEIVKTVSAFGYNARYVGIQLETNAGANPEKHRWFKNAEGHYRLH